MPFCELNALACMHSSRGIQDCPSSSSCHPTHFACIKAGLAAVVSSVNDGGDELRVTSETAAVW